MACKINANLSGTDGIVLKIFNFFVEKGLTPMQACAICGNVKQESSYIVNNKNPDTGAYGLFQYIKRWHPDFEEKNDIDYQLNYTWNKYNKGNVNGDANPGSDTYKKWKDTNLKEYYSQNKGTLDEYVELWTCAFERCSVKEYKFDVRKGEARRVAELYNKYTSGECAKIDVSSTDNGSVNTDTNNVTDNNGAVIDNVEASVNCENGSAISISGVSVNSGSASGSSNSGAGGFSGTVTNPKMQMVLADTSYYRNPPRSKNGTKHTLTTKYHGLCTYGPSTWYYNAGQNLAFWCGKHTCCTKRGKTNCRYPLIDSFDCIKNRMHQYGFYCAGHWDFEEARNLDPATTFRPGDVATLSGGRCQAHGLMWTGHDWRSDCIEKNICSAYSSIKHGQFGNYSVSIWRHRDFQEPGKQNDPEVP